MTAFMNRHADLLGLETTAAQKIIARRAPVLTLMISVCLVMGVLGGGVGAYVEYKEIERAEIAKQEALRAAEEKAKNRERDARAKALTDLAMRYQHELEQKRKRVVGTIENAESYRDQIPQVKKFLTEYQLPEDVNVAIRQPVDLLEARGHDSFAIEVNGATEPKNLNEARAKWQRILTAAGRYAEGIDRNNAYFNGYLREMKIDEQFKREFGKRPMQQQGPVVPQPQAEAKPVSPAEPVVEQAAVEPAAPVAEAAPAPAPKPAPAPRAAQPAKPKAVPVGGGRVQVTDW